MSDFVWEWPVTWDAWPVGQSFDAQAARGDKYVRDTITRTTERKFTCGCSFVITVHSDFNSYTIGQLRGTAKQHLRGDVHEKTMAKMSKSVSKTASKSSSMSQQPSTAPQQALSTLSSAVPLYIHIFFYYVSCKDIHFFVNILWHCL